MTDGLGHTVNFRNTIIVMTSNVGATQLSKPLSLGFKAPNQTSDDDYEKMRDRLEEAAKKQFRPEFINRLDDLVVFRELGRDDIRKIIDCEIDKISQRLKAKGGTRLRAISKGWSFRRSMAEQTMQRQHIFLHSKLLGTYQSS